MARDELKRRAYQRAYGKIYRATHLKLKDARSAEYQRARYQKLRENPEFLAKRAKSVREWSQQHPERRSEHYRRKYLKQYGLTIKEYDRMLEEQKGVCAICGQPETFVTKHGKPCRLAVDHDHTTGKVRALLCGVCNKRLGHLESAWLTKAEAYLVKHQEET
jgi:hypothetical protein